MRRPLIVSDHATKQFAARYCEDGTPLAVARERLERIATHATRVEPSKRGDGSDIWQGPRIGKGDHEHRASRLRFVVGPDDVVRTVIPRQTRTRVLPGAQRDSDGVYRDRDVATTTACEVCGVAFIGGRHGPQKTCGGAACMRETNRRRCAAWYLENRERHLANVARRAS